MIFPPSPRCQRNVAGSEEDIGFRVAYTPCGKPATHLVEDRRRCDDWYACAEHAAELEADGIEVQSIEVAT